MFVFKSAILPYPSERIIPEVIAMLLLFVINLFRISLGKMPIIDIINIGSIGNKTEQALILLYSILLGLLNIVGHVYFGILQTYVMFYDIVFSGIGLLLLILEILISFVTMFYIKAHEKTN